MSRNQKLEVKLKQSQAEHAELHRRQERLQRIVLEQTQADRSKR